MEPVPTVDDGRPGTAFRAWANVLAIWAVQAELETYISISGAEREVTELAQTLAKACMLVAIHSARMSGAQVEKEGRLWYVSPAVPL
jgi:hypothetical protein